MATDPIYDGLRTSSTDSFRFLEFKLAGKLITEPYNFTNPILKDTFDATNKMGIEEKWFNPSYQGRIDTVDGAIDDSADTKTFTVDNPDYLTIDDILQFVVGGEKVKITAINRSSGLVTVAARGAYGSTKAAHADGAQFVIMGNARPENWTRTDVPIKNFGGPEVTFTNYAQTFEIFDGTTTRLDTIEKYFNYLKKYDEGDRMEMKMTEFRNKVENQILHGDAPVAGVLGTSGSRFAGLPWIVRTNTVEVTDTKGLKITHLNTAFRKCKKYNGNPSWVLINDEQMQYISEGWTNGHVIDTVDDDMIGRSITRFKTFDGTVLKFIPLSEVPSNYLYLYTPGKIKVGQVPGEEFKILIDNPTALTDKTTICYRGTLNLKAPNEQMHFCSFLWDGILSPDGVSDAA